MNVHPKLRRMFRNEQDAAVSASFVRSMMHSGKTEAQAMELVSWYHQKFGADSKASFDDVISAAHSHGLATEELESAAFGWRGAVQEAGGDPSAILPVPAPSPADDARRKSEIHALLKSDRSAYMRDQDLQDELQLILQRESREARRGPEVSSQVAKKPDASPNRRAEIENIMKSDRARYFKDTAMQTEYRSLIAGEQSGGAAEPVQTFANEGAADA